MSQSARRIIYCYLGRAAIVISFLTSMVTPALAVGKKPSGRKLQERAARMACLSGDYTKGVAILSELFVDTKNPTYVFNQGRCFEQNHRYEDALSRFEEYLRVAQGKLDAADQEAAEKHIADCRKRLPDQSSKDQASSPQPLAPPPYVPTAPSEPTSTPESSTSTAAQPKPQPTPTHSGSRLLVAGIVTASVGVAATVAGVLLNLKVNGMVKDMDTTLGDYESRNSDRKTYQTLAWMAYGVGAAAVVTGAILYGVGLRAGRNRSTSVALLPAIGPGQAGALLTGGF